MHFYRKNKFHAVRTVRHGISFDSIGEADYYDYLKLDASILHIDVHVPVTLLGGVRLNVDFFVYRKTDKEGLGILEVHEFKGRVLPEFVRLRKIFDEVHPLSPLKVISKKGKHFIEI